MSAYAHAYFSISVPAYAHAVHASITILTRKYAPQMLAWNKGAVIAQACHAAVAAIARFGEHEMTRAYLADLPSMTKIVLATKSAEEYRSILEALKAGSWEHYEWVEQPENVSTCIALRPYPKSVPSDPHGVGHILSNLRLLR